MILLKIALFILALIIISFWLTIIIAIGVSSGIKYLDKSKEDKE